MDTISTAELIGLALDLRESLDNQFQYWLTITFAVLVTGFVAGDRLSKQQRLVIAGLYLLSAILFLVRTLADGTNGALYLDAAIDRGAVWFADYTPLLIGSRVVLFLGGTVVTLWYLYFHDHKKDT